MFWKINHTTRDGDPSEKEPLMKGLADPIKNILRGSAQKEADQVCDVTVIIFYANDVTTQTFLQEKFDEEFLMLQGLKSIEVIEQTSQFNGGARMLCGHRKI